jgi:hypothetical protein
MEHALPADLPLPLLERLRAEGIATLEAWVALGRRRRQIFGVTRAAVAQLDALAKAALRAKP